jgi:heme-degrading monooxygenase HmoA
MKYFRILFPSLLILCLLVTIVEKVPAAAQSQPGKKMVARIWHGRVKAEKADEYTAYLTDGLKQIDVIPGNLGVQMLKRMDGDVAEFYVISYWDSRESIKKFAGENIEKVHPLARDNEYLIDPEQMSGTTTSP